MRNHKNSLFRTIQAFPRRHVVAAGAVSVVIGVTLAFSPSEPAEAERTSIPLALEDGQAQTIPADALATIEKRAKAASANSGATQNAPTTPAQPVGTETQLASLDASQHAQPSSNKPSMQWTSYEINSGDTLSKLFDRAGFGAGVMLAVVNGEGEAGKLERLYAGETVRFGQKNGELAKIELQRNRLESLVIDRTESGFKGTIKKREPQVQTAFAAGSIDGSLYLSAKEAGLNDRLTMEMAGLFGWEIDFVYDIRKGDTFEVLYETKYLDGEPIGTGNILAASFINQGERVTALRYTDENGDSDYYTPDGHSIRKEFLRTPINARVSSPFNLQRRHPVLDVVRPHEGTDYAAPPGTPIKASGDGRIRFAGWKGGYGRTVVIQHGDNISTLYAHMRAIKRGIRQGKRVEQGDVVGYLGSSGMVTGPHLHYEFRINGSPRNSRTVDLPEADPIPESKMAEFKAATRPLVMALEQGSEGQHQLALGPKAQETDG